MTRTSRVLAWALGAAALAPIAAIDTPASAPGATVTVRNPLSLARTAETIVLPAADIKREMGVDDLRTVYLRDGITGKDVLAQAIDTNDDGRFDELVFQADFAADQVRTFTVTTGEQRVYTRDQFKAFGRFVRERRDDFAWENDRVAHRMYGAALETWVQEPLTSSGVDVWVKRTPRLIINDWYMVDDYHRDNGEGADLYSVGRTRGCGGNGLWINGRLYPSGNFRGSRVLANGPIRVMFELTYEPWDANGLRVSEVKRITLDAGQQFNRFESTYTVYATPRELQHAIGIRKNPASQMTPGDPGVLRTWEPFKDNGGHLGCAIVIDPAALAESTEASGEYLIVARVPKQGPATYFAGSAWDKAGVITSATDWDRYTAEAARRLLTPPRVTIVHAP
jgi:hypothetical protein